MVYAQKVCTEEDVQKGLMKMRIRFADVTHVSCGYRLNQPYGPYQQGGVDDGEPGAYRAILSILKEKNMENFCVFVARWFGGKKLGPRRYQILKMLTNSAVSTYQFKTRERMNRLQRTLSQTSLDSFTSQDTDKSFATAEVEAETEMMKTVETTPVPHNTS